MSSFIASAIYDAKTKTLLIQFKSGSVYTYRGVPAEVGLPFAANPTGAVFNATIRPTYG